MKLFKYYFIAIVYLILFAGCADLKHINTFSSSAVKTVTSYNDVGYTFTNGYNNYTLQKNAYHLEGDLANNVLRTPSPIIVAGEPALAMKADQAITFYITGISSYFDALAKLSDKDLVNYNFDDAAKNLKADASLKSALHITDDSKIDATASIAKVFTNELMGAYRERKIKEVMLKYDPQVSLSIETLVNIFNEALLPHIDASEIGIDAKYAPVLANRQIDMGRKIDILKDWQAEKSQLKKYKSQISLIVNALQKIRDEHHQTVLALQNNKLSSKQIISLVNNRSAEVYQLYINIKTLSK